MNVSQVYMTSDIKRCKWAETNEFFFDYHDNEWGTPLHDDRALFEFLNLEGAQAGLSWLTILKKRDGYRKAFDNFNAIKISRYDSRKVEALMKNEEIVRNRLKINATIENAKAFLKVQAEFGSFDSYIWRFQDSKAMSKDMKKRGFKFVGPTICYAFMQAVGIINDHSKDCFLVFKS